MSKLSLVRPLPLLGAIVMLAPAAANAAAPAKHEPAKASHSLPQAHRATAHHERQDDADTWMMLPVGFAAVGFAIRRQQRALGSLQPLVN
jgi:hypothetical protein